jgi:phosphate transport system substrate-binding protein
VRPWAALALRFAMLPVCCLAAPAWSGSPGLMADPALLHFAVAAPQAAGVDAAWGAADQETLWTGACSPGQRTRPLLALTTRPPTRREVSICLRAGAAAPWSVPIGREAVFVLANGPNWPGLDSADLHRALAASIPGPGGVPVPNAARSWRDVDAGLPVGDIDVLLPSPGQAARDLVERTVLEPGCLGTATAKEIFAAADRESVCTDVRAGMGVTEADPDLDTLAWLRGRPGPALALVTQPAIERLGDDLVVLALDGLVPTYSAVTAGEYPASRIVYLTMLAPDAAIRKVALAMAGEDGIGPSGSLVRQGLTPLPAAERVDVRTRLLGLPVS